MIYRLLFSFLCLTLFLACGDDKAKAADTGLTPSTPVAAAGPAYPSIELARLEYLWNNATYMDATFYKLPISMNQNELAQIRSTIATVGTEPLVIPANTEAMGHIWFQVNGKNIEEADIYFAEDCVGYVWYENGKPAYSNQMTQDGVMFYNNVIQSVPKQ